MAVATTQDEAREKTELRSAASAEALLLEIVGRHADALLRVARSHSLCADDAHDAYQRSLELFLRNGRRLRAETAHKWLYTVCRNEAQAVRRSRQELVGFDDVDFDRLEAREVASPEERALAGDDVSRSAEALCGLKPAEVRALWLRASGWSYAEIQASTGWSYTKVNRALSEGRRAFLARYARIEDGTECARWAGVLAALAEGDAPAVDLVAFRPHLRNCPGCKATLRRLQASPPPVAIVLPPVLAGPVLARDVTFPERLGQLGRWLGRVTEVLTGPVQERAAAGVVRAQALAEAASTGKLAAVAASAAALTGGGAVTDGVVGAGASSAAAPPARSSYAASADTRAARVALAGRRPSGAAGAGHAAVAAAGLAEGPSGVASTRIRSGAGAPPTPPRLEFSPTSERAGSHEVRAGGGEFAARVPEPRKEAGAPAPRPPEFAPGEGAAPARVAVTPIAVPPASRRAPASPPTGPGAEFGP